MMTMERELIEVKCENRPMVLGACRLREERLRGKINQALAELRAVDWPEWVIRDVLDWLEDEWDAESGVSGWNDALDAAEGIDAAMRDCSSRYAEEMEEVASLLRQYGTNIARMGVLERERVND